MSTTNGNPAWRVRRLDGFDEAAPAWRRLEAEGGCHAFQSLAWQRAWFTHVGQPRGLTPALVLVEGPAGQPWMLFPLGLQRRRFVQALVFLGGQLSDYLGPLVSPDCPPALTGTDFRAVWAAVTDAVPAFSFASLERLPATLAGRPNPLLAMGAHEGASRSHHTRLGPDWPTYYASRCSSKTRATDRRKRRKLEEAGPLSFEIVTEPGQVDAVLEALTAFKSQSWQQLGVTDLFAGPEHRALLRSLSLEHPGFAHLSCLKVGGRVVAAHWGLLYGGRFYYMLPSYEQGELASRSPGALLCRMLLEWCCQQGVEVFDFTVGDEPYKERWCEEVGVLYECMLPHSAFGHLCAQALVTGTDLKKRIKASPRLYALALRVRADLAGLRG